MRIGIGYDIHKLVENVPMVLGGVEISLAKGPEGHSDGDALLHAICDAVLGALGKGDIGIRFPDTDPEYKDISSVELLRDVVGLMLKEGFCLNNLDCIIILEEPKIVPYREKMSGIISKIFGISSELVNVKGKTSEKIGEVGKGNAVEAYATILLDQVR